MKQELVKRWNIDDTWTLFLDRDGVLNSETFETYISRPEDFIFLEKSLQALKILSRIFNRIIIVTNQQGVGKKLMTESDLKNVNSYMLSEIEKNGGTIDAVYSATDLRGTPNGQRKPGRAMADLAKKAFPEIDFEKSIMVGNSMCDVEFGNNLNMKTVFIGDIEKGKALFIYRSLFKFAESLLC